MNFVTEIPENVWLIILKIVMLEIVKENVVEELVNVRMENVLAGNVLQGIIARIASFSKLGVVINQNCDAGMVLADVITV